MVAVVAVLRAGVAEKAVGLCYEIQSTLLRRFVESIQRLDI